MNAYVFGGIRLQDTEAVKVATMDDLLDGVKREIEAKLGHGFFE